MTPQAAIVWLEEASKYFEGRDTRGEDKAHWSNVQNAERCREIVAILTRLTAEIEALEYFRNLRTRAESAEALLASVKPALLSKR